MFRYKNIYFSWLITPGIELSSKFSHIKQSESRISLPIEWEYFAHHDFNSMSRHKLSSQCIEALKATIRHKKEIKGNIKNLIFRYKKSEIKFGVELLNIGGLSYIHLNKVNIKEDLNDRQIISLSHYPKIKENGLNIVIQKLFSIMNTGDFKFRSYSDVQFDIFPFIHISPIDEEKERVYIDKQYNHLITSIGTQHPDLNHGSEIVNNYIGKNLCIRNQVSIVDKQSMLVISERLEIENIGIYHCCMLALHLQYKLRHYINHSDKYSVAILEYLANKLENSVKSPSLITNSVTIQKRWSSILNEFKIQDLIQGLKVKLELQQTLFQEEEVEVFDELCALADKVPNWKYELIKFKDYTDWPGTLNTSRKILEDLVTMMMEHVVYKGKKALSKNKDKKDATLDAHIKLLSNRENWLKSLSGVFLPDDIFEIFLFLKGMGNIGSHSGKEVYINPEHTVTLVIELLHRIMKWFVDCFLIHAYKTCPQCEHQTESFYYVCLKCNYKFEMPIYQSCSCESPFPQGAKCCLVCAEPFVQKGDSRAIKPVVWY